VRDDDTIDIGGMRMGTTKKFRNVQAGSRVAFVVDIVDTSKGWHPIYLEIRGSAEALSGVDPPADGFSPEIIKIHPDWIKTFNLPSA
jgi:pyridoxamine 5'-phosphate oxidase family protein